MADIWADLVAKTNLSANDIATAINQLIANERLMKGGVAATTPSTTIEDLGSGLSALQASLGFEVQTMTGTLSLSDSNKRRQRLAVNGADRIVKLPSTSILKGDQWELENPSIDYSVDVQGSSSGTVWKFWEGSLIVQANQDTPTTSAHWDIVRKWTAPVNAICTGTVNNWAANAPVVLPTVSETHSGTYNTSTGKVTIKKSGWYQFSACINGSMSDGAYLSVSGVDYAGEPDKAFAFAAVGGHVWGSGVFFLNGGGEYYVIGSASSAASGNPRVMQIMLVGY